MALQQVVHSSSEYRVAAPLPRSPQRLEDTGLDFGFVVELLAKVLFLRGQLRLPELSAHIKLPAGILDQVPAAWLSLELRPAYVDILTRRLKASSNFVQEAIHSRAGVI